MHTLIRVHGGLLQIVTNQLGRAARYFFNFHLLKRNTNAVGNAKGTLSSAVRQQQAGPLFTAEGPRRHSGLELLSRTGTLAQLSTQSQKRALPLLGPAGRTTRPPKTLGRGWRHPPGVWPWPCRRLTWVPSPAPHRLPQPHQERQELSARRKQRAQLGAAQKHIQVSQMHIAAQGRV